jgi:hypothetical protein
LKDAGLNSLNPRERGFMRHKSNYSHQNITKPLQVQDFSLVMGGPLYQLLRRSHMTDDYLGLLWRRMAVIPMIAWLPLLLISLATGQSLSSEIARPFLLDAEVHVRFLLVIPLLVAAELLVHLRLRPVVQQFLARELIPDAAINQFNAAIESAMRLRNSVKAEIIMIAVVYTLGAVVWRQISLLDHATWYATPGPSGPVLSAAGWWYAYVSLPIFQFLVLRWYFRIVIWARFLWQVSRIKLRLLPTHADRLGGLSFVSGIFYAFGPLAAAHGAWLAAILANRIFYHGATLPDFRMEIVLLVIFLQLLVLGPLLVFAPQLAQAKRDGLREYGMLVMKHHREFDEKWLRNPATATGPMLGTVDNSSLADLDASFDVIREMRGVPVTKDAILFLAGVTVAPLLPLALTMMSLEDLLRKLAGILF